MSAVVLRATAMDSARHSRACTSDAFARVASKISKTAAELQTLPHVDLRSKALTT